MGFMWSSRRIDDLILSPGTNALKNDVRMVSSVSGVTASAHGVRSRTCAARMAQNEMSRVGVRDLDLRAVVEPVLAEVVAIWLESVTAGTSPRAAPISAHRVIDASHARPTDLIPPGPRMSKPGCINCG